MPDRLPYIVRASDHEREDARVFAMSAARRENLRPGDCRYIFDKIAQHALTAQELGITREKFRLIVVRAQE